MMVWLCERGGDNVKKCPYMEYCRLSCHAGDIASFISAGKWRGEAGRQSRDITSYALKRDFV
jgi:hypothetical protein